jgi:hypothetical protein
MTNLSLLSPTGNISLSPLSDGQRLIGFIIRSQRRNLRPGHDKQGQDRFFTILAFNSSNLDPPSFTACIIKNPVGLTGILGCFQY